MTTTPKLLRRHFMAAAVGAGSVRLGKRASSLAATGERVPALPASDALAALCAELGCAPAIGKACLQALPAPDSNDTLTTIILRDAGASDRTFESTRALASLIKDRSRDDFQYGRIAVVDGWVLSLTETRLYALAAQYRHGHAASSLT